MASNAISATTQLAAIGAPGAAGSETQIFCYDSQERLVWAGNTGTPPAPGAGTCGSGTPSTSLPGGSYQDAYQYTHLDQLWQGPFNGSGTQQYLYCNSSAPHQLTGIYNASATCSSKSGKVYGSTYDAWGNVLTRTLTNEAQPNTANLSYNQLNQFIEWQDTDPNTNQTTSQWNVYDASGARVLQRTTDASGTTTLTVYPFGDEEYHYTANGSLLSNVHYDSLGGQLLAERSGGSTPSTTMLLTDALGSVISTFSNKGSNPAVLGNQLYDPYGTQRYQKGTIDSTTTRGFTGQYNDPLTGLDYYGARFYDPAAGVFLSADSVQGNAVGENPYAYVGGNPETMTDPSGNLACTDVCGHGSGGDGGGSSGGSSGGSGGGITPIIPVNSTQFSCDGPQYDGSTSCSKPQTAGVNHADVPVTIPAHTIPPAQGVLCSGNGIGGIGVIGGVAFAEANIGSCGLWDNGGNVDTGVTIHVRMQFLSNEKLCLSLLACASEAVGDRTDLSTEGAEEDKGSGVLPSTDGSGGAAGSGKGNDAGDVTGTGFDSGNGGVTRPVNSRGDPYPRVIDPRTGNEMPFPEGNLQRVDPGSRVDWNPSDERDAFIKEWYKQGYGDLPGPWKNYDLHHILPREFGGTNDFWNLIPLERQIHQGPAPEGVTAWWNAYFP